MEDSNIAVPNAPQPLLVVMLLPDGRIMVEYAPGIDPILLLAQSIQQLRMAQANAEQKRIAVPRGPVPNLRVQR